MDASRSYAHYDWIFPFHDAPETGVRVLWYPVPAGTPGLPHAHIFPLRDFDRLNRDPEPELGTRYTVPEYYTGPLPLPHLGEPCGTPEQWIQGLSYADYLAGAYSCDCPEGPMPSYVSSLVCDDGSIDVSAPTGDVVIHLNPETANHWSITQYFRGASVGVPAVIVEYLDGQTYPPLVILNSSSQALAGFYPPLTSGDSLALVMARPDNANGVTLSGMTLKMTNVPDARVIELTNGPSAAQLSAPRWFLLPTDGVAALYGSWIVGTGIDASYIGSVDSELCVYAALGGRTYADVMIGDQGGGPELLQALWPDGYSAQMNGMMVGEISKPPKARFHAKMTGSFYGFQADQDAGGAAGVMAFYVLDKTGAQLWAIDDSGIWNTGLQESPTGTGSIIYRLEIRDNTGALLGYLPIYDTL